MSAIIEKRAAPLEIRASGRRLEGYAALFGSEARIGKIRETIAPKAFGLSLASGRDVLALADHDPAKVLARTRSGTLRLSEDTRGLAFDLDVPGTNLGRDLLALAERGDLGGMSFGFRAVDEKRDGDTRQLRQVDLIEISIVQAFPAYAGTTIEARNFIQNNNARRQAAARYLQLLGAH